MAIKTSGSTLQDVARWMLRASVALGFGLAVGAGGFFGVESWIDARETALAAEVARGVAASGGAKVLTLDAGGEGVAAALEGEVFSLRAAPRRLEWSRVKDKSKGQIEWVSVDLSAGDLRAPEQLGRVAPFVLGLSLLFALAAMMALQPRGQAGSAEQPNPATSGAGHSVGLDEETRLELQHWGVEAAQAVQTMAARVRVLIQEAKQQRRILADVLPQLKDLQKKLEGLGSPDAQEIAVEIALLRDQLTPSEEQAQPFADAVKGLTDRLRTHLDQVQSLESKLRTK